MGSRLEHGQRHVQPARPRQKADRSVNRARGGGAGNRRKAVERTRRTQPAPPISAGEGPSSDSGSSGASGRQRGRGLGRPEFRRRGKSGDAGLASRGGEKRVMPLLHLLMARVAPSSAPIALHASRDFRGGHHGGDTVQAWLVRFHPNSHPRAGSIMPQVMADPVAPLTALPRSDCGGKDLTAGRSALAT